MRCYLDSIRMTSVYLCMCLQSVHICVCTLHRWDTDCSRSLQKRQNSVTYTRQTFAFLSCEGLKKWSLPGRWTHTRQGLLSSCSAVFEAFILWSQGATPVPTTVSSGEQERRKTCFLYGQNLELAGITWPDLSTIVLASKGVWEIMCPAKMHQHVKWEDKICIGENRQLLLKCVILSTVLR